MSVADTCEHWTGTEYAKATIQAACPWCHIKILQVEVETARTAAADIARDAERLKQENEQLRNAIGAHERAVCDNPKAAGQSADERLWSVLHPAETSMSPTPIDTPAE